MAIKRIIEVITNTSKATKNVEDLNESIEETGESAKKTGKEGAQSMGMLNKATGGAIAAFQGLVKGVKSAIVGMKTLRGAVMATGIGALVIAVVSLISYFKRTEEGAQRLRVIMAVVGNVFDQLMDVFVAVGEALFDAINNPRQAWDNFVDNINKGYQFMKRQVVDRLQANWTLLAGNIEKGILKMRIAWNEFTGDSEEAQKLRTELVEVRREVDEAEQTIANLDNEVTDLVTDAVEGFTNWTDSIIQTTNQAAELERAMNRVKVQERELTVARAEALTVIQRARFAAEDETKSIEERVEALKSAIQIEEELTAIELANERERLRILEQQASLSSSDEQTLDEIAEQKARIFQLEASSLQLRRRAVTEVNGLEREAAAKETEEREAREKAEQEALEQRLKDFEALDAARRTAQEKEIFEAQQKYQALIELANQYGQDTNEFEAQRLAAIEEINAKYRQQELDALQEQANKEAEIEKQKAQAKIDIAQGVLGAVGSFLAEGSQAAKAVSIAQTTIDTYQSAVAAYKSTVGIPVVGTALAPIAAATAVAAGIAQIRKISQTQIPGATGGGGGAPSISANIPSTNIQAADVNVTGGNAQLNQIQQSIERNNDKPIKTYVVSEDVTTEQALNRRIKDTATFG